MRGILLRAPLYGFPRPRVSFPEAELAEVDWKQLARLIFVKDVDETLYHDVGLTSIHLVRAS